MKSQLGKLERLDLREVWVDESQDFTPWLAKEENIKLLGDALGLEFSIEGTEVPVGAYSADILCKEMASDKKVVIENQLGKTDHSHLGQILTYAAGLDASILVWIAQHFTEEHRAAIDLINSKVKEDFSLFAVEIEAWRIGDSLPAPKFNVVCKPNDWSKTVAENVAQLQSGDLTDAKKLQLEFWANFQKYAIENGKNIKPTKPLPQHWMNIAIGRSGFKLAGIASFYDSLNDSFDQHELRAEVVIYAENAKVYFDSLMEHKLEIEKEVGESLVWYTAEGTNMCRIYLRRTADIREKSKWPEMNVWLLGKLETLHKVFASRIKTL